MLLLFFGVHRALLRSGVLPPLTASSGSKVVQALLRYGFIIALVIILFGFALETYKTAHKGTTPQENAMLHERLMSLYDRTPSQKAAAALIASSDEDRKNAANSTRELEDILRRSGAKLIPKELIGLGYAYLISGELDKAKTAFLDARAGDPSLPESDALLSVVYQLEAHDDIERGKLAESERRPEGSQGIG